MFRWRWPLILNSFFFNLRFVIFAFVASMKGASYGKTHRISCLPGLDGAGDGPEVAAPFAVGVHLVAVAVAGVVRLARLVDELHVRA